MPDNFYTSTKEPLFDFTKWIKIVTAIYAAMLFMISFQFIPFLTWMDAVQGWFMTGFIIALFDDGINYKKVPVYKDVYK